MVYHRPEEATFIRWWEHGSHLFQVKLPHQKGKTGIMLFWDTQFEIPANETHLLYSAYKKTGKLPVGLRNRLIARFTKEYNLTHK